MNRPEYSATVAGGRRCTVESNGAQRQLKQSEHSVATRSEKCQGLSSSPRVSISDSFLVGRLQLAKMLSQPFAGTADAGEHRAQRDAEHIGRFLVGQFADDD